MLSFMPLVAHAPADDPVQRAEYCVQKCEYRSGEPQPSMGQVRHWLFRQAGDVADLLERHGGKVQHASATHLLESVNLGDVSARSSGNAPLGFNNHIVAVAEGNRTG